MDREAWWATVSPWGHKQSDTAEATFTYFHPYLVPPRSLFPVVTTSLFFISVSLPFCFVHQSVVFFRFHIQVVSYSIYLLLTYFI